MNRLRVITLTLLVLVTTAGMLPITESLAKWSRHSAVSYHKRHRRHSRAWWRRHRAMVRARRARAEQRRLAGGNVVASARSKDDKTSLLSFNANAAAAPVALASDATAQPSAVAASVNARATMPRTSLLPFDFTPPHTWAPSRKARAGAAVFNVTTPDGRAAGTAVVAPVSLSQAEVSSAPASPKTKTVGGLSLTALRRTVIDRMVAEGGWVTNDFVQEVRGRRVFVVLAQTGVPGAPAQSWAFYFTEIDGRVYSLATNAPVEFAEPLAAGSEQFMASLQPAASQNTASQR